MKMIRTTISTLALTYFLLACGQTPTPNNQPATEQKILGTAEIPIGDDGLSLNNAITVKGAINESGLQVTRLVSKGTIDSATERYSWSTVEFKNITTGNLTNVSLYAYNESAINAAGTAYKLVRRLDDTPITNTNVIRSIQPSAGLILNAGVFSVNPAEADFQVFRSSEASAVDAGAKVLGSLLPNDSILEYGFTIRSASGDRTLVPNELGVVTLAFRVPLQTIVTDTPRRWTTTFTYATDAITRVTRDKSETTAQVVARAATPVSATEAVLVGTDTDLATPLATIRLLGFSTYTVPNQPIATITTTGGYAKLGRFIADVPSGALNSATTFTLTKPTAIPAAIPTTDEFLLNQVPGAQVVSLYKITSSVAQYQNPIQVVIPIDIPFSGAVNDYVTELYRWDGSSYTTLRIDKGATNFLYEPIRLAAGGDTFVAVRAPISAVTTACTARAGVFNGVYCELPFDSVANSAAVQPGNTRARALDQYKMVSFNVGNALQSGPYNAPFYCGSALPNDEAQTAYVFKLCSLAVERSVREALRQDGISGQIDLLALQELWNNECSTSLDTAVARTIMLTQGPIYVDFRDRVCTVPFNPGKLKQIERLLPTAVFDYHCSPVRSFPSSPRLSKRKTNGYECIAIRKQHFEFTLPEFSIATIQPACPGETENTTTYYIGSDTGFQVERVRLKGALGTVLGAITDAEFDFINSHMVSPPNSACRRTQLNVLYTRYRNGANPKPLRILIAGDMNTDPTRDGDNTTTGGREYFNRIFNPLGTAVNAISVPKMGYLLDDPAETTVPIIDLSLTPYSLDHVITNFADAPSASPACSRQVQVRGTDHKRTICTLTGFDSGRVRAGMQLLDTSDPNAVFTSWNAGTVTASRRGIPLTYVKTTIGSPTYDSTGIASNLPVILNYQACRLGSIKTFTNTVIPGGSVSNGVVKFAEFLSICL